MMDEVLCEGLLQQHLWAEAAGAEVGGESIDLAGGVASA